MRVRTVGAKMTFLPRAHNTSFELPILANHSTTMIAPICPLFRLFLFKKGLVVNQELVSRYIDIHVAFSNESRTLIIGPYSLWMKPFLKRFKILIFE